MLFILPGHRMASTLHLQAISLPYLSGMPIMDMQCLLIASMHTTLTLLFGHRTGSKLPQEMQTELSGFGMPKPVRQIQFTKDIRVIYMQQPGRLTVSTSPQVALTPIHKFGTQKQESCFLSIKEMRQMHSVRMQQPGRLMANVLLQEAKAELFMFGMPVTEMSWLPTAYYLAGGKIQQFTELPGIHPANALLQSPTIIF